MFILVSYFIVVHEFFVDPSPFAHFLDTLIRLAFCAGYKRLLDSQNKTLEKSYIMKYQQGT